MSHRPRNPSPHTKALLEALESRVLFSAGHLSMLRVHTNPPKPQRARGRSQPVAVAAPSNASSPAATSFVGQGYTPTQIRHAYGFDQISFGTTIGDGTGQTIAIVDAFNDPNITSDLAQFDAAFNIAPPPSFTVIGQDGSNTLPPNSSSGSWSIEISLDVEWAHAIAPGANIVLVEATDNTNPNLFAAVKTAANLTGVSVVSMSFGGTEFFTENGTDRTIFVTPAGHNGVTFVASTGDNGAPGNYPAFSKNVVAIGGTTLNLNPDNTISTETGWSDSGGGISQSQTSLPAYQVGIVTQSTSKRSTPDLALDADPNTGVPIYDSFDFNGSPWQKFGGTSLSAPLFAGLMAIADQGRASLGLSSLDGPSQTLPTLYSLPASDFNDILSGSNSNTTSAGPGYDLVTGRGSPIANKVVFGLIGATASISGTAFVDNNSDGLFNSTDSKLANTTLYIDSNNDGLYNPGTLTSASATPNINIPDGSLTGVTSNLTISGATSTIANLTVNVNITHPNDADLVLYLVAPNGTQIALANTAGGAGDNFSNTTFSDFASSTINSASAPFNGSFKPTLDALADFDGLSANGVWKLRVADTVSGNTGTLNSWSLNITTGPADLFTTTTDANGNYSFHNLPLGASYTVRAVLPAGLAQTSNSTLSNLLSNTTNLALTAFPTSFTTSSNTNSYYLTLDNSSNLQIFNSTTPSGSPAFQVPLAKLPSLTFNLQGTSNTLNISFANGSPIPLGNITLNATAASSEELQVLGQNPSQPFTLTNTQIGPSSGGAILFNNLPTLTLGSSSTTLTGDLTSLQNLNLNADEFFTFG